MKYYILLLFILSSCATGKQKFGVLKDNDEFTFKVNSKFLQGENYAGSIYLFNEDTSVYYIHSILTQPDYFSLYYSHEPLLNKHIQKIGFNILLTKEIKREINNHGFVVSIIIDLRKVYTKISREKTLRFFFKSQ